MPFGLLAKGRAGPAWPPTPPPTNTGLGLYWRLRSALLSLWRRRVSQAHRRTERAGCSRRSAGIGDDTTTARARRNRNSRFRPNNTSGIDQVGVLATSSFSHGGVVCVRSRLIPRAVSNCSLSGIVGQSGANGGDFSPLGPIWVARKKISFSWCAQIEPSEAARSIQLD